MDHLILKNTELGNKFLEKYLNRNKNKNKWSRPTKPPKLI